MVGFSHWHRFSLQFVTGIGIHVKGTVQEMRNGGAAHVFVRTIHLHEQDHIGTGVFAGKWGRRCAVALGQWGRCQTIGVSALNQPCELLAAVSAGVAQVAQHHAFVALAKSRIVKAFEHSADVGVALQVSPGGREFNFAAIGKARSKLYSLSAAECCTPGRNANSRQ